MSVAKSTMEKFMQSVVTVSPRTMLSGILHSNRGSTPQREVVMLLTLKLGRQKDRVPFSSAASLASGGIHGSGVPGEDLGGTACFLGQLFGFFEAC